MSGLSHLDNQGRAAMVDVTPKAETERVAVAGGLVRMAPATLALIVKGNLAKGDVLATARIAGIMAAKRTADLIPLCHPLPLTHVMIDFVIDTETSTIAIESTARTAGRTGVEMEAMTAVAIAGLTLYDMAKAVDRKITLDEIRLIAKSGGKSGPWRRSP